MGNIFYKKRRYYKYNLHSICTYSTGITVTQPHSSDFIDLAVNGDLTIKKWYAWDGPSGPTFDTKNFMRGSLVHDALYQLIREKVLPQSARKKADQILRDICLADGMSSFRAGGVYYALRLFGSAAAKPDLKEAP